LSDRGKLGRIEVIGAWLRLWTPPRGADVPPVPWRKLAIGGALTVAALGVAAALAVPRIERGKEEGQTREQERLDRRRAADRRRRVAEQRPVRATVERRPGPLAPGAERRVRVRLLAALEGRITADARRRARAGELESAATRTECVPAPSAVARAGAERVVTRRRDVYDCLAITRVIGSTATNPRGAIGYPFRAVVDFERGRLTWCKTNPAPGERAVPDPRRVAPLPRACRLPA
jgi:hypothetical protein